MLVRAGMREKDALGVIFEVATELANTDLLPEFPDGGSAAASGEWLVAAAGIEFYDLVIEMVAED